MSTHGKVKLHSKAGSGKTFTRRHFLRTATLTSLVLALPATAVASLRRLNKPISIGMIADLHHDVMHDGEARMGVFATQMASQRPDAIIQLGDFAYPNVSNKKVLDMFNQAHSVPLHVIGNHDMDSGHTKQQCIEMWGMPGRYYAQNIGGLWLLVLDGNDSGSPVHKGGYPSYVGEEQTEWLKKQLSLLEGPIIVFSHQPLAGAWAVDNAVEIQNILSEASDNILMAINGHSHIDDLRSIGSVTYMHLNSASYQWVGGAHQHQSYPKAVHENHPWISYTCPYKDVLFATMTVDPDNLNISIAGMRSEWVGPSPAELGLDMDPTLTNGEEIAPRIRDRRIIRVTK